MSLIIIFVKYWGKKRIKNYKIDYKNLNKYNLNYLHDTYKFQTNYCQSDFDQKSKWI